MFDAEWILQHAGPMPEPASRRRPALLKRALQGQRIVPAWPLDRTLASTPGTYPGDGSELDSSRGPQGLPPSLGQPGSQEWAVAVETIDEPIVAIPLAAEVGISCTRLVRVFVVSDDTYRLVSLDLESHPQGRGRAALARLGTVTMIDGEHDAFVEQLREFLEDSYLSAQRQVRDRMLRPDESAEPIVLLVTPDRSIVPDIAAVAATFGAGVRTLQENIAMDVNRLEDELADIDDDLVAVVLFEPSDDARLAWVADAVRARVDTEVPVERLPGPSGGELRALSRLVLYDAKGAGTHQHATLIQTCRRCQPAVARLIREEALAITTVEAAEDTPCLCERTGAQNLSIRVRLAVELLDDPGVLLVGYQPNFDTALAGISGIEHIRSAGDPRRSRIGSN